MGKIKLYGITHSPPVRAVKLTLAALQIPYEFVEVDVTRREQHSEEYLKKNPQHTIPVLQDDDAILWDSHAIMAYLVTKYGKDDALYPKDPLKRAVVDQRMYFEAGVVFANALRLISVLVLFSRRKVVPLERIRAIEEAYEYMELFLKDQDYFAGDHVTIADFSLISSVTSMVAYVDINADNYPRINAWIKRMEQLPYYEENAFGAGLFVAFIKAKQFTVSKL